MNKKYIIAAALLLIVLFTLKTLFQANFFSSFETTEGTNITILEGPPGMEDITIDQDNGKAYISSQDRWNRENGHFVNEGGIYLYSLNTNNKEFIKLTEDFKPKNGFYPHGLSLFKENDSTKYLFVVNHSREGHVIETFKITENKAAHLRSITSPAFLSPNDIHAISPTKFFITNDHNTAPKFVRTVTDFLKVGTGTIVFYNGDKGEIVADGIPYANGIHTSKDGKKLFVASTNANKMRVYDIKDDYTLEEEAIYNTGIGVDNIELDPEGNLYIGCHPQLLKFLGHAKDSKNLSPTVVLKMTYDQTAKTFSEETLYTDDGSNLSGGSVAAPFTMPDGEQVILVGSVYESKVLVLK